MNRQSRLLLAFLFTVACIYLFFFEVIARKLNELNTAREEELAAATINCKLQRRIPREPLQATEGNALVNTL